MCRECNGLGKKLGVVSDDFLDLSQVAHRRRGAGAVLRRRGRRGAYAASRPLRQAQEAVASSRRRRWTCCCTASRARSRCGSATAPSTSPIMGIIEKIERAYIRRDIKTLSRAHAEGGRAVPAAAAVPVVQGRASQPGGARLQDRRPQHRRAVGDGDRRADAGRPARSTSPVGAPIVASARRAAAARGRHRPRLPDASTARPTRSPAASRSASRW